MKKLLILVLIFVTIAHSAITLSGTALLQGQTDNSGIKVRFVRSQPTTAIDSTTTSADGSYSLIDSSGYYTVSYFKTGYFVDSLMETPYYAATAIATQTLSIRTTRLNVPAQFPTIQLAIDQAKDGDTILVSPGTYKENIVWTATNFILASQILLTNDTSFISRTIIDGNAIGSVLTISGVSSPNAMLSGFTIQNGNSSTSSGGPAYGGGVNCLNSSLRMKHLAIMGNSVSYGAGDGGGGGMALRGSSATVDSVFFQNNSALGPGGGCDWCGGDAMFVENDASIIQHAQIIGNSTVIVGGSPTIQQSTFSNFTSGYSVITIANGASVHLANCEITKSQNAVQQVMLTISDASAVFENIRIHDNTNIIEIASITSWFGSSNVTFKNSSIFNNSTNMAGFNFSGNSNNPGNHPCQIAFTNCTFVNNAVSGKYSGNSYSPALLHELMGNATVSITNCMFNRIDSIACRADDGVSSITAQNNLFFNNSQSNFSNCGLYLGKNVTLNANGDSADAYGNIQANPYFVNSDAGNYHLSDWSRAIGAGTASGAPATDIEGTVRGNPPDIGAYENARNTPALLSVPGIPLLASPANGAMNLNIDTVMQWTGDGSADYYQIQLSTFSDLHSTLADSMIIGSTTFKPRVLLSDNTTYYWRVKAVNKNGSSAWTATWSFKTAPIPTKMILVSPSNGSINVPFDVMFRWAPFKNAVSYKINVISLGSYSLNYQASTTDTFFSARTIAVMNSAGLYPTTFSWKVQAVLPADTSQWSSTFIFSVSPLEGACLPAPMDGSRGVSPTATFFSWRFFGTPSPSSNRLQISLNPDVSSPLTDTLFSLSNTTTAGSYSKNLLANTTYYWRVNIVESPSTPSTIWSFTTSSLPPTLVSPANNAVAVSLTPTLSWNTVNGFISYHVQLSTSSSFSNMAIDDSTLTSASKTTNPLLPNTTYYWHVSAKGPGGAGAWSDTWSFTTIPSAAGAPTLASPANSSTAQPLNASLSWNAVSGASTYRVQLSTSSSFTSTIVNDSTITSAVRAIGPLSTSTTYYWRVNTKNAGGTSPWSDIWNFSTVPPAAGAPTLVSPTNSATNQTLNLSLVWAAVTGASTYRVQVSSSSTFAGTVVDDSTLTSALKAIGPLSTSATYYWRVNAKSIGGTGAWSETWTFTTVPPPTAAPTLATPSNTAVNQPLSLSLTWNAVPGASTYRVQVSISSAFASTIVDDSTLTSPSKQIGPLSSNSTFYWRANTSNPGGASPWSTQWSFSTLPPVPNQVSRVFPAPAAIVAVDSIKFVWNKSAPVVDKYCLEIFTDSLAGSRFLIDSTITDTVRIVKGLSNKKSFWWQVKAHNIAGWSMPSGLGKFTVQLPTVAVLPKNFSCILNGMSRSGSIIRYGIPKAGDVSIKLFNIQGKLLKTFLSFYQRPGYYQINIGCSDLSKGCYLLDFHAGEYSVKRKLNTF